MRRNLHSIQANEDSDGTLTSQQCESHIRVEKYSIFEYLNIKQPKPFIVVRHKALAV